MENTVKGIIKKMSKGEYFDSHYVIDTLIREHSDDYFEFIRATRGPTETVHGEIAKLVRGCGLVRKVSDKSISYTIHATASPCALWERI